MKSNRGFVGLVLPAASRMDVAEMLHVIPRTESIISIHCRTQKFNSSFAGAAQDSTGISISRAYSETPC